MKSAAAILLAAALASASPAGIPGNVDINCAKPNANFCMSVDTILNCNGAAIGKQANCGASMKCTQSGKEAGDAKCVPDSGTTGVMSIPEGTNVGTATGPVVTGTMSIPEGTDRGTATETSETGVISIPEGTSIGTATGPIVTGTMSIPEGTHTGSSDCPAPTNNGTTTRGGHGGSSSTTPGGTSVPTAAAGVARMAGGAVAAAFVGAALML